MTDPTGKLTLPSSPDIEFLRREAKLRLAEMQVRAPGVQLSDAQLALARDYGFPSWRALKVEVDNRFGTSGAETIIEPDEIAQRRAEQALPRKAIPYNAELFDRYVGYYQLGPNTIFTITRDSGRFYLQLTGQVSVEVFPESDQKFFAKVVAAQVSFIADPQGNVTELVLHQAGAEQIAKRIDEKTAKEIEVALQRRQKDNMPSLGTEAILRRHIEGLEKGLPEFDIMSPELAAIARQQMPSIQQYIKRWGALKSLVFKAVSSQGWDIYEAVFEHGQTEWRITPLSADGTVKGLGVRELP